MKLPISLIAIPALSMAALLASPALRAQEAASAAGTEPTTTTAPRSFEELDTNLDGAISKDEAAVDPALTQVFGTLDEDADGRLTPEEYAAYAPGNGPQN
ncbi:EF-hand domain-containing protein [Pseudoxanthomonas putridarboris]|uniref:EF-hand domain-containing protein n=1 Tax=Pseudoxanthomonas putridarboris TaxID=752605 RepID=A0ABU9IVC3_9GAMM